MYQAAAGVLLVVDPRTDAGARASDEGASVELDRELRRLSVLQRREILARRRARLLSTRTGATRAAVLSRRAGAAPGTTRHA